MLMVPRPCDRRATAAFAWLTTACLAASALAAGAQAQPPEAPKRVLVLHWYHKDFPLNVSIEQGRAFAATDDLASPG